MPPESPPIIARPSRPAGHASTRPARPSAAGVVFVVFSIASAAGAIAAVHFARLDLTLSHYDARAHLAIARRVFDSLTPGWRQVGGLWLPLPHLINLVPVVWNWNYRTGALAVAVSVLACAWGLGAFGGYLYRRTNSLSLAIAMPLAILLNPNLLYLQSTPMTEPLLVGLSFLSLAAMDDWIATPDARATRRAGLLLAALVLTRYEGWFVAIGLVAVGVIAVGVSASRGRVRTTLALVQYPAVAILAFLLLSRASTGAWLVTSGFFVPNNPALGHPLTAMTQVLSTTRELAGPVYLAAAAVGVVVCIVTSIRRAGRSSFALLLPLGLLATVVLPVLAFQVGHPERVRYMVPFVTACGGLAAVAFVALPVRARGIAALAFLTLACIQRPPFAADAPVVRESLGGRPQGQERRTVTRYLQATYDGTPILASMTSLGAYMQETSAIGLNIRNYLHEGNGDLWIDATRSPRRHVRWILIEEDARGGDVLALRARADPSFLSGFTRVAEGGGVALYRRTE